MQIGLDYLIFITQYILKDLYLGNEFIKLKIMKKNLLIVLLLSFVSLQLFALPGKSDDGKKLKNKHATLAVRDNYGQVDMFTFLYNLVFFGSEKSALTEPDSIPESKTHFKREGNVLEGETSFWENDKWNKGFKFVNFFNAEANIDSTISFMYDTITTEWRTVSKYTAEYSGGAVTNEFIYVADSATGRWDLFIKTISEYNNDGYLTDETSNIYVADSGKFFPMQKEEYFVDAGGVEDSSKTYIWVRGEGANFWMPNTKTYSYYKANGAIDYDVEYSWNYVTWVKNVKTNYFFNNDGVYLYELDSTWADINWMPSSKDERIYTEKGEPLIDINSRWVVSENSLLIHDKVFYIYGPNTSVSASIIQNGYSIFPNPASDFVTINIDKPRNASVRLFDMAGRLVLQQGLNSPSTTFSVAKLKRGNLVAKITNNNKVQTQVIILK